MTSHIKLLKNFIYENAGNNQHEINEENLQVCMSSIEAVIRSFFKGRKHSLSPSGLGAEPRKMWHLMNNTNGENKDQFKTTSRIKMLVSSVAEFLIVFLMKEAGVKITNEQELIHMNIGGHGMRGSNDYAIGNKIYDFKCTSDEMFRTKWRSSSSLLKGDEFGYIAQGGAYNHGASWSTGFGGWDVYNLDNGNIKHISAKKIEYEMDMSLEHVQDKIKKAKEAKSWKDLPPCENPYINNQGVAQLHWKCARCPFVGTCFPNFHPTKKHLDQVSYIKNNDEGEI